LKKLFPVDNFSPHEISKVALLLFPSYGRLFYRWEVKTILGKKKKDYSLKPDAPLELIGLT
jgi:hypothetical protein